ncbi:hypothetical protein [uncultured Microbulbifer sp.]|uniref:hypothetical protein n=1 Tax=uncultured Microbulbifer sp. TaxID=348147 RepID=UPI00260BF275|nr:hypothetical protein [uncultured Microbulbifer sp.]
MKNLCILIFLNTFSCSVFSGTLYSFDEAKVRERALQHIHRKYSEFVDIELTSKPLQPVFDKKGHMFVSAIFSYKATNELGVLYVCAKVDENGELVNIEKEIPGRRSLKNFVLPKYPGCWGKP